jgi:putative hydrolase of the HAD superfamily
MTSSPSITTLFIDVGHVLLTDSWGPAMRQKAVDKFGFDFADVAQRSQLTFEGYEEGKVRLGTVLTPHATFAYADSLAIIHTAAPG